MRYVLYLNGIERDCSDDRSEIMRTYSDTVRKDTSWERYISVVDTLTGTMLLGVVPLSSVIEAE